MTKSKKTIKRCSKCILPEELPSVKLGQDDVCNQCKDYEKTFCNWDEIKKEKKAEFENILANAKKQNQKYDCLIPLSGGKDSTYALYLCDKVYNLKCLCATFDNGYLTSHARRNIQNAINATNADHIFLTVNRDFMISLYRMFLKKTSNFCVPCMRGIGMALDLAHYYNIPLTVSGTGKKVSYMNSLPEMFQGGDVKYFRNVIKDENIEEQSKRLVYIPTKYSYRRLKRITCKILRLPNRDKKHYISLYDYIDPDFDEIYTILKNNMGWEKAGNKFEHLDCFLDNIVHYCHRIKFPFLSESTVYNSHQIRMGLLDRNEALEIELNKLKSLDAPEELDLFLNDLKMDKEEFISCIRNWKEIHRFRDKKRVTLKNIYYKIAK